MDGGMMNKFSCKELENNVNSNPVDHRTAKNMDERTMVNRLEHELNNELEDLTNGNFSDCVSFVGMISALIDARIDLDRVNRKAVHDIETKKPAFIPLTEDHPKFVRSGDRFNISPCGGAGLITVHVVVEKDFIPGLREIEVKPFDGYGPVEPGCPFDDYEYKVLKNKD